MKEKEKSVILEMAEQTEQAFKNWEQAFRSGLKLQQEAGQWWNTMMHQAAAAPNWQKPFVEFANEANRIIPAAQKRVEEVVELMEKNVQSGTDLFKKAVDAAQTPVLAERQAKWMDFWNSSLSTAQSNAEAMTQINIRTLESWIGLVQRNTRVASAAAAKSA